MYPYYSKLDNQSGAPSGSYMGHPSPYGVHQDVPRYPSIYRRRSPASMCLRCCCCFCGLLVFIAIALVIFILSLFHVYDPKAPEYKIESLHVNSLEMLPDTTLNAEIRVNVTVENPNKEIGFNFGADNYIQVMYMNHILCNGRFPAFHQAQQTSRPLDLLLIGRTPLGPELQGSFKHSQDVHNIPVDVNVKVPVNIILGEVMLREFRMYVFCHMTLDNLSPNNKSGILSKDTMIKFEV